MSLEVRNSCYLINAAAHKTVLEASQNPTIRLEKTFEIIESNLNALQPGVLQRKRPVLLHRDVSSQVAFPGVSDTLGTVGGWLGALWCEMCCCIPAIEGTKEVCHCCISLLKRHFGGEITAVKKMLWL